VLLRLEDKLRDADSKKEATQWLDKTKELVRHAESELSEVPLAPTLRALWEPIVPRCSIHTLTRGTA
jgi:hypothetical protein